VAKFGIGGAAASWAETRIASSRALRFAEARITPAKRELKAYKMAHPSAVFGAK
jgi:hypothetical protein